MLSQYWAACQIYQASLWSSMKKCWEHLERVNTLGYKENKHKRHVSNIGMSTGSSSQIEVLVSHWFLCSVAWCCFLGIYWLLDFSSLFQWMVDVLSPPKLHLSCHLTLLDHQYHPYLSLSILVCTPVCCSYLWEHCQLLPWKQDHQ